MFTPSRCVRALGPVITISATTFRGLARLRAFHGLLIFALALIGSSVFLTRFTFQQEFQLLKDVSFGAMNLFSSLLAVLATAQLIPRDLEDRTIYSILAKPVGRMTYLIGKLAGVVILLAASIGSMSLFFLIVLKFREQTVIDATIQQMAASPPEQIAEVLKTIRHSTFNITLIAGIAVIYLKACLLASLTLFISTFSTTTIFTTMVMAAVYLIGHLQSTARAYWLQINRAGWITDLFLAIVVVLFPDLQLFDLVDDIVANTSISGAILVKTAALGLFYIVVYLLLAWSTFRRKEL